MENQMRVAPGKLAARLLESINIAAQV